jgi:hypothetical protein
MIALLPFGFVVLHKLFKLSGCKLLPQIKKDIQAMGGNAHP